MVKEKVMVRKLWLLEVKVATKIKPGYHKWPFDGDIHPVGEKHKVTGNAAKEWDIPSGTLIEGEETESVYYRYQPGKYKEGK